MCATIELARIQCESQGILIIELLIEGPATQEHFDTKSLSISTQNLWVSTENLKHKL